MRKRAREQESEPETSSFSLPVFCGWTDGRTDGGTEGGQVEVSSLPSLPIFSCDVISTKMSTQNTKGKEEGTRRKKKRSTMDDGEIISRIRPTRRSELPLDAMERGANL